MVVINKVQVWLIHILGGKTVGDVERLTEHLRGKVANLEKAVNDSYHKGMNQMVVKFDIS